MTPAEQWLDDQIQRFRMACERNPSLRADDDFEGWMEARGIVEPDWSELETASEGCVAVRRAAA